MQVITKSVMTSLTLRPKDKREIMPKNILVLGARGFLGEHIVQLLAAADYQVLAAIRPGSKHSFLSPRVTVLEGNLTDSTFVRAALERADAVIFSAGRTWQPGLPIEQYHRQNVDVVQTFFEALDRRPDLRVVFTSSLSTIGGSSDARIFAENTGREGIRENWLSPYDSAKIACEQIALASARHGQPVVILNPGLLLGPGAFPSSNLAAPYYLLWFCQEKFAAQLYVNGGVTLCDVRDVARAHVAALTQGRTGERYILGGHNIDRREFYARVAHLTGLKPPRQLPAWLLYTLSCATDGLEFLTKGWIRSPLHRSFARMQGLFYYGSSDKAAAELGYEPTPLDATLLDMLQHYQARGLLPASLRHVKDMTVENAPAHVLLKQLARRSGYATFLLPRLARLYATCRGNHALDESLTRLLAASTCDDTARFRWDRARCRCRGANPAALFRVRLLFVGRIPQPGHLTDGAYSRNPGM